ncbi:MAG: tyrosine recombinase XerC [Clostridia bacterium]|nr:tyrosine recombinase XerC [Clostridia bacterium]
MKKEHLAACFPILRDYFRYIEAIKGRSELTVEEYYLDLRTFFRFIKRQRGLAPDDLMDDEISIQDIDLELLRSITQMDILEFMAYSKNERQNTNKTRARKTTSLRTFFRYLTDYTHQLEHNPTRNLETPKPKKSLPKYLSLEQSFELLNAVKGEFAQRDYCMLTLLLNCGLRRAELAALNLEDIRGDHTLRVRGKGNKERILYLNEACRQAIEAYRQVRPVDGVQDKHALFLSRLKKRITVQGVHYVVKNYLKEVPGAENYSTHKLRHTAATLMYQHGGVDIRVLQAILGHENLGTTEIYTHLSGAQMQQAVESNPLANMKPPKDMTKKQNKTE